MTEQATPQPDSDRPGDISGPEEFAQTLDRLRRRSGHSYRALAAITGLGFTTISGYCRGRHLPQLAVTDQFSILLEAIGVSDVETRREWLDVLAVLRGQAERESALGANPYQGLEPFQLEDARYFFGREELVDRLLREVARRRTTGDPLIVVGPSGSGKSSVLRAGLIPALQEGRAPLPEAGTWPVLLITPGATPLMELAIYTAKLREQPVDDVFRTLSDTPAAWRGMLGADQVGSEVVLIVDQFEELFTLCEDETQRQNFLTAVLSSQLEDVASDSPVVVLAFRADFYDRALREPRLAELSQDAQIVVGPLTEQQVRDVVVKPARLSGYLLEDRLVEVLIREAAPQRLSGATYEAGVLPMLSHTLQALVDAYRDDKSGARAIGLTHYESVGGVHGAIARSAEQVYQSLTSAEKVIAHRLFLRLVRVEPGMPDTRRPAPVDDVVDGDDDSTVTVFERFVARRLLVVGSDTVEISHEALLTRWPRLGEWLEEDRVGHDIHNKLNAAARVWRDGGRAEDDLYRGPRLSSTLDWSTTAVERLNPLEREYLDASAARQRAEASALNRRLRRRYQLGALLAVLVLVVAGTGIYANLIATQADRDRESAAHNDRLSVSRQIATTADRLADKDAALAGQLALAAYRIAATPEARSALLDSSARVIPHRFRMPEGTTKSVATAGELTAFGTDAARISLRRADTAAKQSTAEVASLPAGQLTTALTFARHETLLVAGDEKGAVRLWNIEDSSRPVDIRTLPGRGAPVTALAVNSDGNLLAVAAGTSIRLWQIGASEPVELPELSGPTAPVRDIAIAPDGRTLASGGEDKKVRLWDISNPSRPEPLTSPGGPISQIFSVTYSPDGRTLVAGTAGEHIIYRWDVTDPRNPKSGGPPLRGPASWVNAVTFSPDGTVLAAGSSDGVVWRWDTATWEPLDKLTHSTPVIAVSYRGNHALTTLAEDGLTRTWGPAGPLTTGTADPVFSAAFDARGHRLAAGTGRGKVHLWDITDPRRPVQLGTPLGLGPDEPLLTGAIAIARDGTTVIAGGDDGSILLWEVPERGGASARLRARLPVATKLIEAIVVSPDNRTAAVSSDDGTVRLVDINEPDRPAVTATIAVSTEFVYGVRFSPDGRYLAGTSGDTKGYLWDVTDTRNPRLVSTVKGGGGPMYAAAFNEKSTLAAFGGTDYAVRVVDLRQTGSPALVGPTLLGPIDEIFEISFRPGSDVLAISSVDRTIWIWDLHNPERPERLATLQAADDGLLTTAFSPDRHTLVAGTREGKLFLWDTEPDSVAARICEMVGDDITAAEWAQLVPDQPYDAPCT